MFQRIIHLCLALTIIGLAACTLAGEETSINKAVPSTQTSGAEPTPAAFSLTDALNRQVSFPEPPERIVLVGRGVFMLADAIYFFPEASNRIVAIGSTAQWNHDFAPIIDPNFQTKTILENEAGPEQIAAMQPDLVIMKSFMAENLGKPLESLGVPVVYLDFETPEQYPRDIAILGQVFQNPQRASQVSDYYQQRLDQIKTTLSEAGAQQAPRILIAYYNNKDGQIAFNVPPSSWMQTLLAKIAGAEPVWEAIELSTGWTKVNFEQIAAWDPDQVYIVAYTSDAVQVVKDLQADPQWQALRAVKEGQLYAFPADVYSWDQPDSRWILGLTWLAAKTHPEAFADLDMRQEVISFYKELYNLSEAAIQEKIFPLLEGDLP